VFENGFAGLFDAFHIKLETRVKQAQSAREA